MVFDVIFKIGVIVFLGTAIYTLIATEIRQKRLDKQFEDEMKRISEEMKNERK